jgi:hypothetical protein
VKLQSVLIPRPNWPHSFPDTCSKNMAIGLYMPSTREQIPGSEIENNKLGACIEILRNVSTPLSRVLSFLSFSFCLLLLLSSNCLRLGLQANTTHPQQVILLGIPLMFKDHVTRPI